MAQLPIRTRFTGITVILLAANALFNLNYRQKWNNLKKAGLLPLFISLFITTLIGLLWTGNMKEGGSVVSVRLGLLLLPLVILSETPPAKGDVRLLARVFIVAVFLSTLYVFRQGFGTVFNGDCVYCQVQELLPMHRPYIAVMMALALAFIVWLVLENSSYVIARKHNEVELLYEIPKAFGATSPATVASKEQGIASSPYGTPRNDELLRAAKQIALILLAGYFLAFQYLVYAKMVIAVMVVTAFVTAILYLYHQKKTGYIILLVMAAIASAAIAYTNPKIEQLVNAALSGTDISDRQYDWRVVASLNSRNEVYQVNGILLKEPGILLAGVGTGDSRDLQQAKYCQLNLSPCAKYLNAHNQYVQEVLRTGIVSALLLLAMFMVPLVIAVRQHAWLYAAFLIFLTLVMLTENYLDREAGVLFYGLFNSVLYAYFVVGKQYPSASLSVNEQQQA